MWPRHTGDFALFRAYVDRDGRPAPYSADNVPYAPPHHLEIRTEELDEGDFVMVAGYPGGTYRQSTGDEMAWATAVLERNLATDENEPALEDAGGVYALIGSTGVGKTTSTAKIAAAGISVFREKVLWVSASSRCEPGDAGIVARSVLWTRCRTDFDRHCT